MIILASASPRRREILTNAGIDYIVHPSSFDEKSIEINDINLITKVLSYHKAKDVQKVYPNDIIIASDTIVSINNEILGKPSNKKDAYDMLSKLQGKTHKVITGVCILYKKRKFNFQTISHVTFDTMTNNEINEYIETLEPMDKAGAYAIQGKACKYIKSIKGDYYSIVGLPINKVVKCLNKLK